MRSRNSFNANLLRSTEFNELNNCWNLQMARPTGALAPTVLSLTLKNETNAGLSASYVRLSFWINEAITRAVWTEAAIS
jgi:hypothetical protein